MVEDGCLFFNPCLELCPVGFFFFSIGIPYLFPKPRSSGSFPSMLGRSRLLYCLSKYPLFSGLCSDVGILTRISGSVPPCFYVPLFSPLSGTVNFFPYVALPAPLLIPRRRFRVFPGESSFPFYCFSPSFAFSLNLSSFLIISKTFHAPPGRI